MDPEHRTPLPTLLSQTLVAFTIEIDDECEHRIEHRTTSARGGAVRGAAWLVSLVMWANVRSTDACGTPPTRRSERATARRRDGDRLRAALGRLTLPHHPMVLHRRGYPDGR